MQSLPLKVCTAPGYGYKIPEEWERKVTIFSHQYQNNITECGNKTKVE